VENMIIGSGDIASAITDNNSFLFFASGVSNSREKRKSEYKREKDLLMSQNRSKHIVYFSSLCIFYSNSRYAKHKREMENLVKKLFSTWTILRLGNITWGVNPHTLINNFKEKKKQGKKLIIKNTYRYICDKAEFNHWLNMIPKDWSCEMNIPGHRMKVADIVKEFI